LKLSHGIDLTDIINLNLYRPLSESLFYTAQHYSHRGPYRVRNPRQINRARHGPGQGAWWNPVIAKAAGRQAAGRISE